MINKLLEEIELYEWRDYLLAEPTIMYIKDKCIKNNIVMVKSKNVTSIEYYVGDPKL